MAHQNLLSGLAQDSLDMSLDIRQQTSELVTPNVIEASLPSDQPRIGESSQFGEGMNESEVVSVATPVVDLT